MIINAILIAVFVAVTYALWREGLVGAAVMLLNVLLAAWVMVCFTAASLHTAAVPRDFVQATPEARMFFGLAPDRRWLQWVRGTTLSGPFAAASATAGGPRDPAFDRSADFILRYAARRQTLESLPALRVLPKEGSR